MDEKLYICLNCKAHWIGKQLCTCSSHNELQESTQELNRVYAKNIKLLSEQEIVLRYLQGLVSINDFFVGNVNTLEHIRIIDGDLKRVTIYESKGFKNYSKVKLKPLKEYDDHHGFVWCREK